MVCCVCYSVYCRVYCIACTVACTVGCSVACTFLVVPAFLDYELANNP